MEEDKKQVIEENAKKIKEKIKQMHDNQDVEEAKKQLRELLVSLKPWDIPLIEQSLIKEGTTISQIALMCNLHVELFREHVLGGESLKGVPAWHPLDVLIKENHQLLKDSEKLTLYVKYLDNISTEEEKNRKIEEIKDFLATMFDLKKHYFKQQMLLFPYIERRGITGVPRVLWAKEEEILDKLKDSMREVKLDPDIAKLKKNLMGLSTAISDQIFRETNILYPTCWALLSEGEWVAIQNQSGLIGYYKIDLPSNGWKSEMKAINPYEVEEAIKEEQLSKLPMEVRNSMSLGMDNYTPVKEGAFKLDMGYLSIEELESIIKTLPFELTFIDGDDRLRYFTNNSNMIFLRTESTIGRKVEFCHPPSSVHIVKKIVQEFKEGKRDVAEFWININGKKVYIRYFPVKNKKGEYMGTLEVLQDITSMVNIHGEKRLMDSEN